MPEPKPPRRAASVSDAAAALEWNATFDSITDAVLVTALDGRVRRANRALGRIVGRPAGDLVGQSCWNLLFPGAGETADSPLRAMQVTLKRVSTVLQIGGRLYGLRVDPLRDEAGALAGAILILSDITERLKASEAIRENEERLAALVGASPAAIVTMSLDGIIRSWNPAAERMFGWAAEEAIGRFIPAMPEDGLAEHARLRAQVAAGHPITNGVGRRRRRDGNPVDIRFSMAPLRNGHGAVDGLVAILTDVTDLRHAEEVLRQRETEVRQLQKMEAIGRLAGGMAHDFNNLLTSMLGYADLLAGRLQGQEPLHGYAEAILASANRAAESCRHLLTLSRRQMFTAQDVDVATVLGELGRVLGPMLGEDVALTVQAAPDLATIRGDPTQLHQVILNLALNARDAMPRGGRLIVEAANVSLDEPYARRHPGTNPGPYVMVAVSDSGVGMTPEVKAHLFEPFFTTKTTGTGLGLSTAYGMVTQIGGHLVVYSEPGRGSTFKVYYPRSLPGGPTPAVARLPAGQHAGSERLLVVEDRPELRDFILEVLAPLGYAVVLAHNGAEALASLSGDGPDLIVTDVVMPEMGGVELARRARERRPDQRVLYMSGYTDTLLVQQGILDREVDFLQKPFTAMGLAGKVREVLDRP